MTARLCEKNNCFGCCACSDICPEHAIQMESDAEGFLYPRINESVCSHCDACKTVCPANETPSTVHPKTYLFRCNDTDLLNKSTSGGAFSLLAGQIIKDGGSVVGAAFTDDFHLCHIIDTDISAMRKSKYIQSDMGSVYRKIRSMLDQGRPVLFSGTPCQCHAVQRYCKECMDSLYILSVICRGVASPVLWSEYVRWVEKKGRLEAFCFRDKRTANNGHTVSMQIDGSEFAGPMDADPFSVMYLKCLTLRPSCYSCPYTRTDLPFDLSIGDLFNAATIDKECSDGRGASIVLARSKKGQELLERCRPDAKVIEIPLDAADQDALRKSAPLSPLRRMLFRDLVKVENKEMEFHTLLRKYGGLKDS